MPGWVKACAVAAIAPGTGQTLDVGGKSIALFNVDGTFHALDNECPHRGGPLGEGELIGCVVTCPWHAWDFDVRTGESQTDDLTVACYGVRVDGDDVFVEV